MVQMALQEVIPNGLLEPKNNEINGDLSPIKIKQDVEEKVSINEEPNFPEEHVDLMDEAGIAEIQDNADNGLETEHEIPLEMDQPNENGAKTAEEMGINTEGLFNMLLNESMEFFFMVEKSEDACPKFSSSSESSPSPANWNKCDKETKEDKGAESSETCSRSDSIDSDKPINCEGGKTLQSEHDCSQHPDCISTARELELSRISISHLQEKIKDLESQVSLETKFNEKIVFLEQRVSQQEKELELSKQEHDLDARTISSLRKDMDTKVQTLRKQYEQAIKDKEAMVIRYTLSEKGVIDQRKVSEGLDKKLKEALKESELVSGKLKTITAEKSRIGLLLETKISEHSTTTKEIERLKDELNSRDIKIKWVQNKLKTEMDLHKECPQKIEGLSQTVAQVEGDLDKIKKEREAYAKDMEEYQQNKIFELKLKEEQAKMIVERYEHSEREVKLKGLQVKNQTLIEENNNLSLQVQDLEQARFENEQKLIKAREEVRYYSSTVADLQAKIVDFDSLTSQLQQAKEKADATTSEIERLRKSNEELVSDMAACRKRESEMLSFTQKLTTKNVQLQSEFSAVEAKATHLDSEHQLAEEAMEGLRKKVGQLEKELKAEQGRRSEESRLLARQVAEKATRVEELEASLEDHRGEISVLRNKHSVTLKEMQRELHQYRKKVEQLESIGSGSDSLCQGSRTSSLGSLSENHSGQPPVPSLQVDVPTQALVDRIVRLQHEIARQKERIEFLEDHTSQLVVELQKKTKLLQSYILREEAGALTSRTMDSNKAEVTRHGGIMASLYASKPSDDTMTLELSLEINHKLQAILEDTLLKNITLKENLDTLGDEIARLSKQKV